MKNLLISLAAAFIFIHISFGQQQTFEDLKPFKPLLGIWEGQLEYLNYRDNKTRVKLPARLYCTQTELGDTFILNYVFQDPGYKIENIQLLTLNENSQLVLTSIENGVAKSQTINIKLFELKEDSGLKLVFVESGYDDNKSALIRYTIDLTLTSFNTKKETKYENEDFTFRNKINLNRVKNE